MMRPFLNVIGGCGPATASSSVIIGRPVASLLGFSGCPLYMWRRRSHKQPDIRHENESGRRRGLCMASYNSLNL